MNTMNDRLELTLNGMSEIVHNNGVTKKSLQSHADSFISEMIESGELDNFDALGKVTKMQDFLDVIEKRLRSEAVSDLNGSKETFTSSGVSFTIREGSRLLQSSDDHIVQELEEKLKQRKALLKVSTDSKESFYDNEGVEVPKVGYKHAAESVVIKY